MIKDAGARDGSASSASSKTDHFGMDSTARPTSNTDTCVYDIDFAAPDDQPDRLRELSTAIAAFTNSLSSNYLWHKQPFNLELTSIDFAAPIGKQQHQWLHGKTDVTDAVDDEWFIVYLLQQVSTKWQEAVISIEDDDGEFLLIEAADVLPNWVTPQNAQNRVRENVDFFFHSAQADPVSRSA